MPSLYPSIWNFNLQCKANISSKETTIYAKKADYFQAAAQLCHPAGGTHSSAGLFSATEDQLPALQALKHRTKLSFLFLSSEGINLHRHTPYPHAVSLLKHSFTEAGGKPDCCRTGVGRAQAAALSAEHSAFRQLWIFHLKNNGYILSNYTAAAMLFEVPKIQRNKTRFFDIRALTPSTREAPVTLQIFAVPIFFNLSYIQGWFWFLVHASSASTSWLSLHSALDIPLAHHSQLPFPSASTPPVPTPCPWPHCPRDFSAPRRAAQEANAMRAHQGSVSDSSWEKWVILCRSKIHISLGLYHYMQLRSSIRKRNCAVWNTSYHPPLFQMAAGISGGWSSSGGSLWELQSLWHVPVLTHTLSTCGALLGFPLPAAPYCSWLPTEFICTSRSFWHHCQQPVLKIPHEHHK